MTRGGAAAPGGAAAVVESACAGCAAEAGGPAPVCSPGVAATVTSRLTGDG